MSRSHAPTRQVVPHADDRLQSRTGDGARGGGAAGRMNHAVPVAVDDQGRDVDLAEFACSVPRGEDARELASDAGGVGSRSQAMPALSRTHASSNGNPCDPMWRKMPTAPSTASARLRAGFTVAIRHHVDGAGRPIRGAPVVDMIDVNVRTRPG